MTDRKVVCFWGFFCVFSCNVLSYCFSSLISFLFFVKHYCFCWITSYLVNFKSSFFCLLVMTGFFLSALKCKEEQIGKGGGKYSSSE